ncbi:MAG TPA: hypothetical protein VLM37_09545 [Fibrobacteraceae bacterium]|nr:hypothetical protein [Fibrobacteraceae bacterium]
MKENAAIQMFYDGFNCAQSVLYAFREEMGIDENALLRLGAGWVAGELLGGVDLQSEEGRLAMRAHLKNEICSHCVRSAIRILSAMENSTKTIESKEKR